MPFCLVGGRARVAGIGEIVEPLPLRGAELTLLHPPFGCSTPAVYRRWDELGGPTAERRRNDLEPAALAVEPRLAEWRDRLGDATGLEPCLAGSGSTWFVEGAFRRRWSSDRPVPEPRSGRSRVGRVRRLSRDGVGETPPLVDAELLGPGVGTDAGLLERLRGRPRPASDRRSILRR